MATSQAIEKVEKVFSIKVLSIGFKNPFKKVYFARPS